METEEEIMVRIAAQPKKPKRNELLTAPAGMLAIDTETTGVDLQHGCLPFFVSTCDSEGNLKGWEWDVNPKTRQPIITREAAKEVRKYLDKYGCHVYHNAKFDVRALQKADLYQPRWALVEDTLIASHVMASSESHKLKDLAWKYLDIDTEDEDDLQEAVNEARRIGRKKGWRIAAPQDKHFPAMKRAPKAGWWRLDMWLPRAVAKADNYLPNHPWFKVLRKYAMKDAERTLGLWWILAEALEEEGLRKHYQTRRKLLRITYDMEQAGITGKRSRLEKAKLSYGLDAERSEGYCYRLAGKKLDNVKSPIQVAGVLFSKGNFGLKPVKETKASTPDNRRYTVNADAIKELMDGLSRKSRAYHFLKNLEATRKLSKMVNYVEEYEASALPAFCPNKYFKGASSYLINWFTLHPNFNITGTKTTRFSSNSPNAQNISKQEKFNLRKIFGPIPGREWYALDYENIEFRIFGYESGDKRLIKAFEQGRSMHLVIAQELWTTLYDKLGPDKFKKTEQYRWVKNGNFSLIYGASKRKANATYRIANAYEKIKKQLPLIDKFMASKNKEARTKGYVTLLGGYRLQVFHDTPHVAVNYFVQGSAGWVMAKAIIRVDNYLRQVRNRTGEDYKIIMTIHDELVLDFPKHKRNLGIVKKVKALMEKGSEDIGLPTPVDADLIKTNWADGVGLAI